MSSTVCAVAKGYDLAGVWLSKVIITETCHAAAPLLIATTSSCRCMSAISRIVMFTPRPWRAQLLQPAEMRRWWRHRRLVTSSNRSVACCVQFFCVAGLSPCTSTRASLSQPKKGPRLYSLQCQPASHCRILHSQAIDIFYTLSIPCS